MSSSSSKRRKRRQSTNATRSRSGDDGSFQRLVDDPDYDLSTPPEASVLFELVFHCGGIYNHRRGSYIPEYVVNVENIDSDYFSFSFVEKLVRLVVGIKWPVKIMWVDPYLGIVRSFETTEDVISMLGRARIYRKFNVLLEVIVPDEDVEFEQDCFIIISDDDESDYEESEDEVVIDQPELFYMLEWKEDWNANPKRKRVKMCARRKYVKRPRIFKEVVVEQGNDEVDFEARTEELNVNDELVVEQGNDIQVGVVNVADPFEEHNDANDGMWPIAYAAVEKETKNSWKWFLKQLVEDLGIEEPSNWTFMSDQQKGLVPALASVIPEATHRFCNRHIHANMKQDHGGQRVRVAFWKCSRSTTIEYFNINMEKLKKIKYEAWNWVTSKAPSPEHWSRSQFNTIPKSDILTNNHVEIFNKFILEARSLPIIDMFEKIRLLIQKRTRTNKETMERYPGRICPRIVKKLDKRKEQSKKFIAYWTGGSRFDVCGVIYKVVVDLEARTCDCRLWQLSGVPCAHAMSALMYKAEDPEDYVHICYHKSTYMKSYENLIEGISGPELWLQSSKQPLMEPIITPQPGRPKKKRNKSKDEPKKMTKLRKFQVKSAAKCGNCGEGGHNKRRCNKQSNCEASTSGTKKLPVRRK